jgi:outer membrane protein OmpA-like peptidoglycan-associated protein
MKKLLLFKIILILAVAPAFGQQLPKEGDPGKCYVKCITPDKFEEYEETFVVEEAYTVIETIPPTYKEVEEKVVVKEETKEYTYIPAVYETVEVEFISKEEAKKLKAIPATFVNDSQETVVYPKTGRWEYKMLENCQSEDKEDCMYACYVEYPEQVEVIQQKKLDKDAYTEDVPIPEKKRTFKKRVVKTPARVEEKVIPAEYKTIKKIVIDEPAKTTTKTIPEVTRTITKTRLVQKGGMTKWEEIDCGLVNSSNILPILYEYNSARITNESKQVIDDNLLKLMKEKPALNIEISSHTDSRGNADYNMSLSQQRAQSVVNYLVTNGIARERLKSQGFGETQLVNECSDGVQCSESKHKANRRTEFRIIQGKM